MQHLSSPTPDSTRRNPQQTAQDRACFSFLAFLAAFIWWRDLNWMATAGDVLPILVAFPLFWWCGRPWRWRIEGIHLNWGWLTAATAFWIVGIILNLTFFLTLAWTLALWSLLAARLEPAAVIPTSRLLPLLLLAFPWLAMDADQIGWWFRLSAAGVTERLFDTLGFDVTRQGTQVLVQGLPISVDAECSGLKVLQAMLIAGLIVANRKFGTSRNYWWSLPILVVAAWCANTLRVVIVSITALSFGADFATGRFHALGGAIVLMLMFIICLAGFSWIPRGFKALAKKYPVGRSLWTGIAVLVFCALMCDDLPLSRRWSPFEKGGPIAFAMWGLPALVALFMRLRTRGKNLLPVPSVFFSAAALIVLMLGTATSFNVLKHGALVLAASAFIPPSRWMILWLLSAISWMPALGWVAHCAGVPTVHVIRLILGASSFVFGFISLHHAPESKNIPAQKKNWWRPVALAFAVAVTLLWELPPQTNNAQRLSTLPKNGLGLTSVDLALSRVEAVIYNKVKVLKRLYYTGTDRVVVVVIDGSKNRHAVHDPKYCFQGAGWRVKAEHKQPLPNGEALRIDLERGNEHTEAIYWFTDGANRHTSSLRYWWQTSLRRLTFGAWGAEPILVVMQPATDNLGAVDWEKLFVRLPELLAL